MEKLITMTEFTLESKEYWLKGKKHSTSNSWRIGHSVQCVGYAELLQTPLSLSMFIPCNEKGEPMGTYEEYVVKGNASSEGYMPVRIKKYREALDKVLFEEWEIQNKEEDGYYLRKNNVINTAFWSSENGEFELALGGGYNTIDTIEALIRHIDLTPTETCKKQIGI